MSQKTLAIDHASMEVPVVAPETSVGDARSGMAGCAYACADDIAVVDSHRVLAGLVPIERLLAASSDQRVSEIMDTDPPLLAPSADQERVATSMVGHGASSVAVADAAGRFLGLIPPDGVLHVLLVEHDEDMARLGGYLASTQRARSAAEEPVQRRLLHRLPWVLIGLLGAMLSAALVAAFEEQLEEKVLLAFFVPGIVYMADAVGTQTETLFIRGLSVGASLRRVIPREIVTGVVMGVVVAAAFFPFVYLLWGDRDVAIAVALALFASASIATAIAMALPLALQRLGADPAFGSGPLATVVQDLLSMTIYLVLATAIAT